MPKFTPAELKMLRHAMQIGIEDGSLGCDDNKALAKRAQSIRKKIFAALDANQQIGERNAKG